MALAISGTGNAATWDLDPAHTNVQFGVRHLMVSTVRGSFRTVSGVANIDETDPTKSSIEVTIDAASIDTRDAKRDDHLRGADFFDVAKHPTITFRSKKVTNQGDGTFQVTGDLTIRGVTKAVVLDVEGSAKPIADPFGNVKLGGVARTKINRQDFGISYSKMLDNGGLVIGDTV
ncbi:MAG: protein yceI precursor, partial [Acidobacteria bacterium RBG_16_68_9]